MDVEPELASISTPGVVATSIGELHFLDGAPTAGLPNHIRLGSGEVMSL